MTYLDEIKRCNPALDPWETEQLLLQLITLDVRCILEIGTHEGGSMALWKSILKPELIVTVDSGEWCGRSTYGVHFLTRSRSQNPRCQQRVRELLRGRTVDFLFIDGGHTYPEVLEDWRAYSSLVRPGGLVVFHDIQNTHPDCEVWRRWQELRDGPSYETSEIIGSGTGFGLVYV